MIFAPAVAAYMYLKDGRLRRVRFLDVFQKQLDDPVIKGMLLYIDEKKKWYSEKFENTEEEVKMDRMLSLFEYICYLIKRGTIGEEDIRFFNYRVRGILRNRQFQNYFYNLYHRSKNRKRPFPYKYLLRYDKKVFHYIPPYFYNPTSWADERLGEDAYKKYLNW
jgi:hypothetical protein